MAGETTTTVKTATGVPERTVEDITSVFVSHEVVVGELELADVIQMVKIPKGATILDVILGSDDLDSAGPAILLDVGDAGDPDRFIAASTVAQAGGVARLDQVDGLAYEYTEDDTIDVTINTAPTTAAAGTINLTVLYTMNQ